MGPVKEVLRQPRGSLGEAGLPLPVPVPGRQLVPTAHGCPCSHPPAWSLLPPRSALSCPGRRASRPPAPLHSAHRTTRAQPGPAERDKPSLLPDPLACSISTRTGPGSSRAQRSSSGGHHDWHAPKSPQMLIGANPLSMVSPYPGLNFSSCCQPMTPPQQRRGIRNRRAMS